MTNKSKIRRRPTQSSSSSNPPKSILCDAKNSSWDVRLLRDDGDRVWVQFHFPTHDGRRGVVTVANSLLRPRSFQKLLDEISDRLPMFPDDVGEDESKQLQYLKSLVQTDKLEWMPSRCGFHDAATFVSHGEIIHPRERQPRPTISGSHSHTQNVAFRVADNSVLQLAYHSTYVAFAVGVALAAPLMTYVRLHSRTGSAANLLPETATFNFSGTSSSGKSSACLGALSILGSGRRAGKLDFTQRGLAELASDNNDMLLVCDDSEAVDHTPGALTKALKLMIHMIPSGTYKAISRGAPELPIEPLKWSLFALTTSPVSVPELARASGWTLSPGDKVRLFDIPVPVPLAGGIFDRPRGLPRAFLVRWVDEAMAQDSSNAFAEWIQHLLGTDKSAEIRRLTERFVSRVSPSTNGWEIRFARKFGVIYAAMRMATIAGILPWKRRYAFKVTKKCYQLARKQAGTAIPTNSIAETLNAILADPNAVVLQRTDGSPTRINRDVVAIRFLKRNERFIGLIDSALCARLGGVHQKSEFIDQLRLVGIVEKGDGHAGTSQTRISLERDGQIHKRPRMWIIPTVQLERLLKSTRPSK